jgi:hypothetical protein
VILKLQDVQRDITIADLEVPLPVQPVASTSSSMDVNVTDSNGLPMPTPVPEAEPQRRLYKVIQKSEYQLLCHQHNPVSCLSLVFLSSSDHQLGNLRG